MVKPKVSIIIVNYHVKKELFDCIKAIIDSKSRVSYEILVVDNDEEKTIEAELHKKFPEIVYIPNENKGFGQGNNVGSKHAKGEYLFFLNPDTKIYKSCIDSLIKYLQEHKNVGIVAPLLYDEKGKPYPQGARELTPLSAVFSFSIISKFSPNNFIARKYWMKDEWDQKTVKEVGSIPGTAFMMQKALYKKVGGFDEHFFLYFEEHDLCRRVSNLGLKLVMLPQAKVFHALGRSTSKSSRNIRKIFMASRFYYLRKHYGLFPALSAEAVLRFSKYTVILGLILIIGAFLRFHNLSKHMIFIGDQAWYYLAARDMLLTGKIPLIGITASHIWLHQGALWTYILGLIFWIFHFDPLIPGYFTVFIDLVCILLTYRVGKELFSETVGIIASLFYSTSPLIISYAIMPYHTSLIPLFTILYIFFTYKWVLGNIKYFPWVIFTLAVLYNLELATSILWFVTAVVLAFGFLKKKEWVIKLANIKILTSTIILWLIPMIPMIIYDLSHGFPQTLKFVLWIIYRIVSVSHLFNVQSTSPSPISFTTFTFNSFQHLVFAPNLLVSLLILGASLLTIAYRLFKNRSDISYIVLSLVFVIPTIGLLFNKTPSGAYLPLFFPIIILTISAGLNAIIGMKKIYTASVVLIVIIAIINLFYYSYQSYISEKEHTLSYLSRLNASEEIIASANGREYNLKGVGYLNEFPSYIMNYQYLTWWLGHAPSEKPQKLQFSIRESEYGVTLMRND